MACSIPVHSDPILEEKENPEVPPSNNTAASVGDSAQPAVAVDLGVSDGPAVNSPELDDNGKGNPEKPKIKKVKFVSVKHVDSTVDLEKGLDVKDAGESKDNELCGDDDSESVCRVCHLSSDGRSGHADLIQIGCGCKNDLGSAHRHCAEAWFKIRGNRLCEICGETAKNVVGVGDAGFMEEWHDRDEINSSPDETPRCWRGRPLCNFLMACMIVAFILPWFFRVSMF